MLNKLGKLLKYEFRFYFRIMPPLYLALALLTLLALFTGFKYSQIEYWIVLTVIWGCVIGAIAALNFVLIIQRFRDNLLKNPGSLMFTLPVTTWALTASKAVAALCTVLISTAVVIACSFIFSIRAGDYIDFNLITLISNDPVEIATGIILAAIMIFQQICLIYTAVGASHILPRFRLAAGTVLYFAVTLLIERPAIAFAGFLQRRLFGGLTFSINVVEIIPYGLVLLALAALFFWAAGFILQRTLNLE